MQRRPSKPQIKLSAVKVKANAVSAARATAMAVIAASAVSAVSVQSAARKILRKARFLSKIKQ